MWLDPVTLEILATKVAATAEEMGIALQRSGRTIYVKETEDFGTGLMNRQGKIFAYPNGGLGVANMVDNDAMPTIRAVPDLSPGDVIVTNDPYASHGLSTHLPDIHLIQPYFHAGSVIAYGWSFIHSADVGGRVPSSISPSNSEVFQEGLLIPPLKLVREGKLNDDVLAFIRANCRTPEENIGDLKAMLAALGVGARRVADMIGQHGLETFLTATDDIIAYSAAKAREAFRTIPDGTYEFTDYLDDDYVSALPVRIHARLTAADGRLEFDFTGTDPQVASSYNLPSAGLRHTWITIRLLQFALTRDPTIPVNSGIFDAISLKVPKGSILNPVFPAAVGVRHATGNRTFDVINGLLCKAIPDFMRAAGCGLLVPIVLAEPLDAEGRRKVDVVEPLTGGTGAARGMDGVDGRETSVSGMSNNPVESVEAAAAVTVIRYGIRPDSGGPGKWRGGVGLELTFMPHRPGSQVLGRGVERFRFAPWGLQGGRSAVGARIVKNLGRDDEVDIGKIDVVELAASETISIFTPGGGGYGDPLERDPDAVLSDVQRGFVGEAGALRDYGVVIAGGALDAAATAAERSRRSRPTRDHHGVAFDMGREREVWERVMGEELMDNINDALLKLPAPRRAAARTAMLEPLSRAIARGVLFDEVRLEEAASDIRRNVELYRQASECQG